MKKILSIICSLLLVCFLTACVSSDGSAYLAEEVTGSVEEESETWNELSDMLEMLSVDSAEIPEFDSMKESVSLFRESVLNYMCCKNYRKYAGNSALLDEINEEYPTLDVIAAISAAEFESEMYRAFGGSVKITHESTELFTYLEHSDVYIPITAPVEGGIDFELISADETENTYRLEFECSTGEYTASYFALLIKRDDGTFFYSMLMRK